MAGALSSLLPAEGAGAALSKIPEMLNQLAPQDESSKWLAFTAGMGAPTKTGALSEAIGNAAAAQLEQRTNHEKLKAHYAPLISNIFEAQAKQAQQAELSAMLKDVLGPGTSPGAFQAPSDALGGGPTMPASMREQPGSKLANMNPDQVAMLKARGLDLSDLYKWSNDPLKKEAGASYVDRVTGRTTYNPKLPEGSQLDGAGGMAPVPGFEQFLSKQTLATKLPEAAVRSLSTVNLRENADGTKSPVPEISENAMLQEYLNSVKPGAMPPAPRPAAAATRPANPLAARPGDSDQALIFETEMRAAQGRLAGAKTPEEQQRAQSDIAALTREMQRNGATPAKPASTGYGLTTSQQLAKEAAGDINKTWLKTGYEPTVKAGAAAGDMLTNVQVARTSMRNMGGTGWGAEAKALGASVLAGMGIAPDSAKNFAANAETFQNAAMSNLQTTLNAASGPQTEGDAARAGQTFAQLRSTPQGNEFILDLAEAKAQRDQMKARFYEQALPIAQSKGDLQEVDREWAKRSPSVFKMPSMQKWGKT
jgi:hypothetical protein